MSSLYLECFWLYKLLPFFSQTSTSCYVFPHSSETMERFTGLPHCVGSFPNILLHMIAIKSHWAASCSAIALF